MAKFKKRSYLLSCPKIKPCNTMYRYMYRYVQTVLHQKKYDPFIDLGATIATNHMLNVGRAWKLEQGKRE